MYLKQSELFHGMAMDFVRRAMDMSVRETLPKGATLFREEDPASCFYVLIRGRIRLHAGSVPEGVYEIGRTGEAFGWAGLVERKRYTASAECLEETELLKLPCAPFSRLLSTHPETGFLFYRNLAGALGRRLMDCYGRVAEEAACPAPGASSIEETPQPG
jgi:CRP-like cAMP-binding protein